MTPATTFRGRTVALFGLGGSGLATARALQAGGATVVAWDDSPERVAAAAGEGIGTGDLREADWARFSSLVLSPGVPLTHPKPHWTVDLARAAGVEVIGDIEIFCRERGSLDPEATDLPSARILDGRGRSPAAFVAITGTNGKSTTTALVAHILRAAGRDVQMGGNIGTAILSLEPPAEGRIHVVEMSSFQIDLTPSLRPSVGVHMNLSPDHLDRHGTMERYAAIKERLAAAADVAVVGVDDEMSLAIYARRHAAGRVTVAVSGESVFGSGIGTAGSRLVRSLDVVGEPRPIGMVLIDLAGIESLRGAHNAQNAAAAFAVCEALGLSHDEIARGMRSFPGLAHRMEPVARRGRALFVNDSKATNADSTEKALLSFDRIHWIVGGKAKAGGIEALEPCFPKVARAYLIGEAADAFARTLDGRVDVVRCGTLPIAVEEAARDAAASGDPEAVVLLSPACASYDQYPNFEVRGNHFRSLVRALPGVEAP
jgi:UDP-N-acetylmuramoylalanine--D-glutamate ligase